MCVFITSVPTEIDAKLTSFKEVEIDFGGPSGENLVPTRFYYQALLVCQHAHIDILKPNVVCTRSLSDCHVRGVF
jgi:hypothetical protein